MQAGDRQFAPAGHIDQTLVAGQVLSGPASGKMLDGSLLVSEENKDVHALEIALARHCDWSFLLAWLGD